MKKITGNLLDMFDNGQFDVIIHGCNCFNNMGGGIAAQIASRYPEVQKADSKTESGSYDKLGEMMPVWITNKWLRFLPTWLWMTKPRVVINAYTQHQPGADAALAYVKIAFLDFASNYEFENLRGLRIGIPAIGCGIGGLVWEDVERVIDNMCGELDITLVEFVPD